MIVTVTPNPSLDRTVEIDGLVRGAVLRAHDVHLHPGGKGVNVARALLANGVGARAVLPVAGLEGEQIVAMLSADGIEPVVVRVAGRTRSNTAIVEPDGTVTKVNEPGAALDAGAAAALLARTLLHAAPRGWVVLCGSLPPGVDAGLYARMVERLRKQDLRVAVDTSGEPLRQAVAAGPELVKPNTEELAELVGAPLTTLADVVDAARTVVGLGARRVLVSLGADGAALVDEHTVISGSSPVTDPRSAVGAGDAFLAGFLAAQQRGADDRTSLTTALAWGSAAVRLPGSAMPGPADIDLSAVSLDPGERTDERLHEPLVATG
jgi:1-phosphofructokinase